jgi:hypothetical protein
MVILAMYTLNILHPGWLLLPEEEALRWQQHVGLPQGHSPSQSAIKDEASATVYRSPIDV